MATDWYHANRARKKLASKEDMAATRCFSFLAALGERERERERDRVMRAKTAIYIETDTDRYRDRQRYIYIYIYMYTCSKALTGEGTGV